MKIIPQQNYLLGVVKDLPSDSGVLLPEGMQREPYGLILEVGPDCKFVKKGDKILFFVSSVMKFDEDRFVIAEGCVFALCDPEATQDGHTELKIVKNPAEGNHAND